MNQTVVKAINLWKKPTGGFWAVSVFLVVLMLGLSWLIVYGTGGTKYVFTHFMYLPIVLAACFWGVEGGIGTAFIAGVLLGPLMPLDVETHISQTFTSYIYRTIFFMFIGGMVGYISNYLKLHLKSVQDTLDEISLIYANTLKNYAKMVAARDEQTAFHCERVAYNALLVGDAMGLDKQKKEALYWSGLLHDVGKIGVKEKILLKPDKLTAEEFEEIKRHTVIGYELITSLSTDYELVAEGIRAHHEKWNGEGYPDGLKGKEISLFGRILSIVDVFEALTSERPYKHSWEPKDAINYILEYKGIYFDPELVEIFQALEREDKIWISKRPTILNVDIIPSKFTKDLIIS